MKILTLRDFVLKQRQIEEEIMMIGKIILVKKVEKSQQNVRLEIGWMNFLEVFRFHFHTGIEVVLVFEIVIHFIMAEESSFSTLKNVQIRKLLITEEVKLCVFHSS